MSHVKRNTVSHRTDPSIDQKQKQKKKKGKERRGRKKKKGDRGIAGTKVQHLWVKRYTTHGSKESKRFMGGVLPQRLWVVFATLKHSVQQYSIEECFLCKRYFMF